MRQKCVIGCFLLIVAICSVEARISAASSNRKLPPKNVFGLQLCKLMNTTDVINERECRDTDSTCEPLVFLERPLRELAYTLSFCQAKTDKFDVDRYVVSY